jgi:hypothetical protein
LSGPAHGVTPTQKQPARTDVVVPIRARHWATHASDDWVKNCKDANERVRFNIAAAFKNKTENKSSNEGTSS